MADLGATQTDALIAKMEKRVAQVYYQAEHEMKQKLKVFLRDFNEANKQKKKDLKAGKITQEQYYAWLASQTKQKKWLEEMTSTLTEDHLKANMKAQSIVRGFLPEAYAINHNFAAFQVEKESMLDTSFVLYDARTVERIIEERPNLLPDPKPDFPKELRWSKTKINHAITQGVLQGEPIPKIAKRLQGVTDMEYRASIRNARTAMTGAQNAGREDAYKDAEAMGIELEQEWMAALDMRTRDSHRRLDGERVKIGKKFSNGCKYPGDPQGRPEEVYNCRCTTVPILLGFDFDAGTRYSKLGGMDYEEWKYGKGESPAKVQAKIDSLKLEASKVGFGKVFEGIWKDPVTVQSAANISTESIVKKRIYFQEQIASHEANKSIAERQLALGVSSDAEKERLMRELKFHDDRIAFFEKKMTELNELEDLREIYMAYQLEIAEWQKKLKAFGLKTSPFSADAYSELRKQSAKNFTSRRDADKFLRPELDRQWDEIEDVGKFGLWKYTENSNPMNKPLSGYESGWDRGSFVGVGKANWGVEDPWRSIPSAFREFGKGGHVDHARAISALTTAIEKCELSDDMWFVRGSDTGGLAGLLEGGVISFSDAKKLLDRGDSETLRQIIEGQTFQNHAFTSTGIASNAGFSGAVSYRIYAPKGTKGIYAEPQSYFGDTHRGESVLYKAGDSYSSVGSEAEFIMQRGTTYRIVSFEAHNGNYVVTMEVVDQPDYFKTGFEQTIDGGATSFDYKG